MSVTVASLISGLLALVGLTTVSILEAAGGGIGQEQARFSGRTLFLTYCASCHGTSARGDGPLAENLRKPPPDLTQFARQNKGAFPSEMVRRIIDGREPVKGHGGSDMPVWGDAFSRTQEDSDPASVKQKIQALVDFLESIQERAGQ
jgi:mono/diheme cytochrome c family protein